MNNTLRITLLLGVCAMSAAAATADDSVRMLPESPYLILAMGEKLHYPPPSPPESFTPAPRATPRHQPDRPPSHHHAGYGEEHDHAAEMRHAIPAEDVLRIRAAAETGDAHSQGLLGEMYHEGMGVERDLTQAFYWFREGAENGDAASMRYLGRYFKGEFPSLGLLKDYDEAEKWLKSAIRNGDGSAFVVLGSLLFERVRAGEEHRLEEASWWYDRATGGPWDRNYLPPGMTADEVLLEDAEAADGEQITDSTEAEHAG